MPVGKPNVKRLPETDPRFRKHEVVKKDLVTRIGAAVKFDISFFIHGNLLVRSYTYELENGHLKYDSEIRLRGYEGPVPPSKYQGFDVFGNRSVRCRGLSGVLGFLRLDHHMKLGQVFLPSTAPAPNSSTATDKSAGGASSPPQTHEEVKYSEAMQLEPVSPPDTSTPPAGADGASGSASAAAAAAAAAGIATTSGELPSDPASPTPATQDAGLAQQQSGSAGNLHGVPPLDPGSARHPRSQGKKRPPTEEFDQVMPIRPKPIRPQVALQAPRAQIGMNGVDLMALVMQATERMLQHLTHVHTLLAPRWQTAEDMDIDLQQEFPPYLLPVARQLVAAVLQRYGTRLDNMTEAPTPQQPHHM